MDFNRAMIFARVVEHGGFTAAARRLGAPKTTVSKKVAELEAELGVRLLHRTTRTLRLTEAGRQLYEHCLDAIRRFEDGERVVRALQQSPSGSLTVAGPAAILVNFLMPTILRFAHAYREVSITLLTINDLPVPDRDDIDILIFAGEAETSGHTLRLVGNVDLALYASRSYLERRGEPQRPTDLTDHDAVAFVQSFRSGRYAWRLRRDGVEVVVAPTLAPRLCSDDPAAIWQAVAGGQGVGMLPVRFAEHANAGPEIVRVLPDWLGPPIAVRARIADAGSLKSRLFLDAVARWFREA